MSKRKIPHVPTGVTISDESFPVGAIKFDVLDTHPSPSMPVYSTPYRTDGTSLADLFTKGPDHEKDQVRSHVRAPAPVRGPL